MTGNLLETITYYFTSSDYSLELVLFNIAFASALAAITAWIYWRTHKEISYSQSFVFTLVMVSAISAFAMMVIGNSITRAFALLGTFSIIRFRTAVKESKDTAFVFLCLVIGIAAGTGNYHMAIVATIFTLLIIQVMFSLNFGSIRKHDHILSFVLDSKKADNNIFDSTFEDFLGEKVLLNVHAIGKGDKLEFNYNVKLKKRRLVENFLKKMSQIDGITDINLLSAKNDIEY